MIARMIARMMIATNSERSRQRFTMGSARYAKSGLVGVKQ
jgi:hypothetical protein